MFAQRGQKKSWIGERSYIILDEEPFQDGNHLIRVIQEDQAATGGLVVWLGKLLKVFSKDAKNQGSELFVQDQIHGHIKRVLQGFWEISAFGEGLTQDVEIS